MPTLATIDDVIHELTRIVERAKADRSRLGYFAALYRNVTIRVRDGVAAGRFEDGARIQRLDVLFAARYLDALRTYRAGHQPTRSWAVAFRMAQSWPLLIIQHLLLGIHAHINLDLAIAAVETSPGAELSGLKRDFDSINDVLGEMLDDVQNRIARVSPWAGVLDRLGARTDEEIFTFGLGKSRALSWQAALSLNQVQGPLRMAQVDLHDRAVATLATPIYNPGLFVRTALMGVRAREIGDIGAIIDALSAK
ncbi:MAG: DUF5995 family protein [Longimicrobiales bacterium]